MSYNPPFQLTNEILNIVANISMLIGNWTATNTSQLSPKLRRSNRLRTIQASLAIENNTLSIEQVTAVLAGKKVLGLPHEIQEVRNAFNAYDNLPSWQASNPEHLLSAHKLLMHGLVDDAGRYNKQNKYYQALSLSDKACDSKPFVLFMLKVLLSSIKEVKSSSSEQASDQVSVHVSDQVKRLLHWLDNKEPQK